MPLRSSARRLDPGSRCGGFPMIQRLHLLRHGVAVPHGTPGVDEDERPLTPEGEARLKEIAGRLTGLKLRPDGIVTSPLPRARQTAEIVARIFGLEDRLRDDEVLLP